MNIRCPAFPYAINVSITLSYSMSNNLMDTAMAQTHLHTNIYLSTHICLYSLLKSFSLAPEWCNKEAFDLLLQT